MFIKPCQNNGELYEIHKVGHKKVTLNTQGQPQAPGYVKTACRTAKGGSGGGLIKMKGIKPVTF